MANTKITSNVISDDINLGGNPTTTTQSAGNNTTRIATTAFVKTAIDATIDSAPGALDTLNELAAAIGDDANFSTTITNSIATKAPLAGPTFTGDVDIDATDDLRLRFLNGGTFKAGIQVPTSTGDMISGAAVDDLAIRSQANMLFSTGGNTERVRIDSSGNLGVGTTSPSAPLHVTRTASGYPILKLTQNGADQYNTIYLQNSNSTAATVVMGTGGSSVGNASWANSAVFGTTSDAKVVLLQNDSAAVTVDTNQNVGIGNTTPSSAYSYADDLVVGNTSGAHGISIVTQNNTNGALHFTDALAGDDGAASYAGYLAYNHASNYMFFGTSSTERMRIGSGGEVGIGTTSPQRLLHLYANSSGDTAVMRIQDNGSHVAGIELMSGHGNWGVYNSDTVADALEFRDDSAGATRMLIDSSGDVGVGTSDPDSKFHVAGAVRFNTTTTDGDESRLYFTPGGAADDPQFILYRHDGSSISTYIRPGQYVKFENDLYLTGTNARMGMMGADPASDMACHAGADGGTSTKWRWGSNIGNTHSYWINHNNAGVYMTSGSTGWSAHSDERLKENIEDIGSVLDKVKDYRCVKYNRKGDSGNTKIGFIAQDWETDFPQIIDEDTGFTIQSDGTLLGANEEGNTSTDKPKGLCYEETIPVLLKAIQEQQTIIDDLKTRIETLEG